jgi:hypothetical protein
MKILEQIDHELPNGGGFVHELPNGEIWLEFVEFFPNIKPEEKYTVWQCEIKKELPSWLKPRDVERVNNWVGRVKIANQTKSYQKHFIAIEELNKSNDWLEWGWAYYDIGRYMGFANLAGEPEYFTKEELTERWGLWFEQEKE